MTRLAQDADDARRKRRFLEDGAEVTLDTVQEFAPARPRLAAPDPVTFPLPGTAEVAGLLAADSDAEAVLTLDFGPLPTAPDFTLLVFVNTPSADAGTATSDPGFVGTVGFFGHDGHDGHGGADPVRSVLPARRAVEGTPAGGEVTVTLVPVSLPDRTITAQTLEVAATMEVAQSRVG